MISRIFLNRVVSSRKINSVRYYAKDPLKKTLDILYNDMPAFLRSKDKMTVYPEHADVVVIGGGFIGSAVAYWLKSRAGIGLSVVVLEKDFSVSILLLHQTTNVKVYLHNLITFCFQYKEAQRNVFLGTLNQHFSLPENIRLSQYSAEFLRNIKELLGNDVDIQYTPTGSLILASEKYAHKLEENAALLNELGVRNHLLATAEINSRFPWMNTEDVKLGKVLLVCRAINMILIITFIYLYKINIFTIQYRCKTKYI